jgi:HlyD family secretion protein
MRAIIVVLAISAVVVCCAAYYVKHVVASSPTVYRTAKVETGDVAPTIAATGTLEPEELIDIGAQVAGRIVSFGKDIDGKEIDFNSVVEKGSLLVCIDPVPYEAAVAQAEATLEKSKADLSQYEAKVFQTEQELKRAESLRPSKAIADTDYDTAVLNYKMALASVAVARATIKANEAALKVANTNLTYTKISSPVRGTIIERRVNIGQTVVASLNAPSICLIAKDLRRMQIWALVSEANIGRIFTNMPVRFTVDAYPERKFRGKVIQVRKNAQMTSNVVNYMVIVETDNADGKLFPYMTANVKFEEEKRENVLVVPNAALRWKPKASSAVPETAKKKADGHRLWTKADDGSPQAIEVDTGPTDGTVTEVRGDNVKAGMHVIVGLGGKGDAAEEAAGEDGKASDPFLPKFPKRGPPRGPGGPPPG